MADYFLWGGLTVFVAFPGVAVGQFSLASALMVVGFILKVLKK